MKHSLWLALCGLLLTSCMAAGVPYTRDPGDLMAWAMRMHEKGRTWRMKEFVDLAHAIEPCINNGKILSSGVSYDA